VNDHIEDVCRGLARDGWLAVAPHFYHRSGDPTIPYTDIPLVMEHMQALTADGVLDDVDAGLERLAQAGIPPERIGVVGFCMGGTIALVTAARRDIGAAVTFYSGGIKDGLFGFPPLVEKHPDSGPLGSACSATSTSTSRSPMSRSSGSLRSAPARTPRSSVTPRPTMVQLRCARELSPRIRPGRLAAATSWLDKHLAVLAP